jgi:hypothetical protein
MQTRVFLFFEYLHSFVEDPIMSSEPLQRLQDDLATVKAALGTELPCDRSHVAIAFLGAGLGIVLDGLALLGLEAHVRPVLCTYIGLMLAAWMIQLRHLRTRRAEAPALWRWGRKELAGSLVAIVLLVGYVVWVAELARRQGHWGLREAFALASSVCFFLGAAGCAWVAVDSRRWPTLAAAATLVAAGAFLPLCETRRHFYLLVGSMLFLGGVLSGLLLRWQIRRHEVDHAH